MQLLFIKRTILFSLLSLLVMSCNDDESDFTGGDNYITSFRLKQGESSLHTIIHGDSIKLIVPENFTFDGISATIGTSENATLSPDPSEVKKWDNKQIFTVTSYNGSNRTYTYIVEKRCIAHEGNIVLATQADLEAFAAQDVNEVNGSLTIGQTEGEETITTLAPLAKLRKVKYDLIINPTYEGTKLEGLENLECVGALQINKGSNLEELSLPKLKEIAQTLYVDYNQSKIVTIDFPELTSIGGAVTLKSISFLEKLSAPKVKRIWGNLDLSSNSKLLEIELSSLKEIDGELNLSRVSTITNMDGFKALESIGSKLTLEYLSATENLDGFKALSYVGGDCYLYQIPLVNHLKGFSSLQKIGGTLTIMSVPFEYFSDLASLKRVPKLVIKYNDVLKEVNISNIENLTTIEFENIKNQATLTGKAVFPGYINVSTANILISGIKEVDQLRYYINIPDQDRTLDIEKVNGDFTLLVYGIARSMNLPQLTEIGGHFDIQIQNKITLDLSALKKLGSIKAEGVNVDILAFPALETVEGDFYICTANYQSNMSDVQAPNLQSVGGMFALRGFSSYYTNKNITDLNGFTSLKNVGSVKIQYNEKLTSFKGIKEVIPTLSEEKWEVSDNEYNPTYRDMVNGLWNQ